MSWVLLVRLTHFTLSPRPMYVWTGRHFSPLALTLLVAAMVPVTFPSRRDPPRRTARVRLATLDMSPPPPAPLDLERVLVPLLDEVPLDVPGSVDGPGVGSV